MVIIIAILAAIAIPKYQFVVEKNRITEAIANGKILKNAEDLYYLQTGNYTNDMALLSVQVEDSKRFRYRLDLSEKAVLVYRNYPELGPHMTYFNTVNYYALFFCSLQITGNNVCYPSQNRGKNLCFVPKDSTTNQDFYKKLCKSISSDGIERTHSSYGSYWFFN